VEGGCAATPLDTFGLPVPTTPRDSPLAHDRGTVSTVESVESGARGGFHVSLVPEPALDGRTTVFGRVVSGLRVRDYRAWRALRRKM
jgi:cyclophilin family peptidyl-prolyl cis-trans isomerase